MSYYIRALNEEKTARNTGGIVIYRVVKRLSDFKPDDGVKYVVYRNKKAMEGFGFHPVYLGVKGKLKKLTEQLMRLY